MKIVAAAPNDSAAAIMGLKQSLWRLQLDA